VKGKRKIFSYPPAGAESIVVKEGAARLEETDLVVNVRAAKDQLSSLLEHAARGNEVIITSDGQPKAKLVPVRARRRHFHVNWELLRSMPVASESVPTAEEIVREDRDGRT
jgi:prevent-host-death family protein